MSNREYDGSGTVTDANLEAQVNDLIYTDADANSDCAAKVIALVREHVASEIEAGIVSNHSGVALGGCDQCAANRALRRAARAVRGSL